MFRPKETLLKKEAHGKIKGSFPADSEKEKLFESAKDPCKGQTYAV